jgi:hypothetical protein
MTGPEYAELLDSIEKTFQYRPNEAGGERWVVFQDHTLVVIHPERRPRFYKRNHGGVPYEVEPYPA